VLMSIPVIAPIDVTLGEPGVRRLPPPDYEIQALTEAESTVASTAAPTTALPRDAAVVALEEIESAAQISEYHDFAWWDQRIRTIRARLEANRSV
jgi:hypothetical protein